MSECEKQFINQKGETVQLEPYEIPTSITFLDELPRKESSDKIDYQILNALAESKSSFIASINISLYFCISSLLTSPFDKL